MRQKKRNIWGILGTLLWGKYHFWVMNDHLWGPSVHVDKAFKKIQAGARPPPPSRQCLYFGNFWTGTPLSMLFFGRKRHLCYFLQRFLQLWRASRLKSNYFAFTRFCGTKGPDGFTSKSKALSVTFKSDKKGNSQGAECTVACSDFTPSSGQRNSCCFLLWVNSQMLFEHQP